MRKLNAQFPDPHKCRSVKGRIPQPHKKTDSFSGSHRKLCRNGGQNVEDWKFVEKDPSEALGDLELNQKTAKF